MLGRGERKVAQPADPVGGLVDGIVAELGHRGMRRPAAGRHADPERALVREDHLVGAGLGNHQQRRLAEGAEAGEMEGSFAARLLAGGDDEGDAARQAPLADREDGIDESGDPGLHVGAAAAVQPAVRNLSGEGIDRPGRGPERDDVDMAGEGERRRIAATRQAGDEARPVRGEGVNLAGQASALEQAGEEADRAGLVAGRIDARQADEVAGEFDGWRWHGGLSAPGD